MGDGVMRVNTALETTALPPFRVMGLTAPVRFRHEAEDVAAAWQRWLSGSLKDALPAFAPSVYALRHSYHDAGYTLMIGHLVSNDAPLPAAYPFIPKPKIWTKGQGCFNTMRQPETPVIPINVEIPSVVYSISRTIP